MLRRYFSCSFSFCVCLFCLASDGAGLWFAGFGFLLGSAEGRAGGRLVVLSVYRSTLRLLSWDFLWIFT